MSGCHCVCVWEGGSCCFCWPHRLPLTLTFLFMYSRDYCKGNRILQILVLCSRRRSDEWEAGSNCRSIAALLTCFIAENAHEGWGEKKPVNRYQKEKSEERKSTCSDLAALSALKHQCAPPALNSFTLHHSCPAEAAPACRLSGWRKGWKLKHEATEFCTESLSLLVVSSLLFCFSAFSPTHSQACSPDRGFSSSLDASMELLLRNVQLLLTAFILITWMNLKHKQTLKYRFLCLFLSIYRLKIQCLIKTQLSIP